MKRKYDMTKRNAKAQQRKEQLAFEEERKRNAQLREDLELARNIDEQEKEVEFDPALKALNKKLKWRAYLKEYRKEQRLKLIPKNRICPKCNNLFLSSRAWVIKNGSATCRKCFSNSPK